MKPKGIILTIMASTILQTGGSFAKTLDNAPKTNVEARSHLEFIPVKISDKQAKGSIEYKGSFLLPLERKPLHLTNFEYRRTDDQSEIPGIQISLSEKDQSKLAKLTTKYLNHRLAVIHNGRVLSIPKIKSSISNGNFFLSFDNVDKIDEILEGLGE